MRIERRSGAEEIRRAYLEMLDGRTDPHTGYVLSPRG
jgi:hypothetical protein